MRVALVTAREFAHLDEDLPLIMDALDDLDVPSEVVDWHAEGYDWSQITLAVIRSTWDYTWQLEAFLGWAGLVSAVTELANPFEVIRWNADKRYLLDLARDGVPVVPTTVLEPGEEADWDAHREIVVKPVVSAGGKDTDRYRPEQSAEARMHVQRLHAAGRSAMVQPYLTDLDRHGETGLVFVGDELSHAFRKGPILAGEAELVEGLYRREEISPREPSGNEREVAEAALDAIERCVPGAIRRDLLYARVDLAPRSGGAVVMELELIEPSFFCAHAPGAAERVARAIKDRLLRPRQR